MDTKCRNCVFHANIRPPEPLAETCMVDRVRLVKRFPFFEFYQKEVPYFPSQNEITFHEFREERADVFVTCYRFPVRKTVEKDYLCGEFDLYHG